MKYGTQWRVERHWSRRDCFDDSHETAVVDVEVRKSTLWQRHGGEVVLIATAAVATLGILGWARLDVPAMLAIAGFVITVGVPAGIMCVIFHVYIDPGARSSDTWSVPQQWWSVDERILTDVADLGFVVETLQNRLYAFHRRRRDAGGLSEDETIQLRAITDQLEQARTDLIVAIETRQMETTLPA